MVLAFAAEWINHGDLSALELWVVEHPAAVAMNFALFASFIGVLYCLLNRLDGACQIATFLLLLPLASLIKEKMLLQPLFPSDIDVAFKSPRIFIWSLTPGRTTVLAVTAIGVTLAIGWAVRRMRPVRLCIWPRSACLALSLGLPTILCAAPDSWLDLLGVNCHFADGTMTLGESYDANGFVVSFLVETNPHQPSPPGYSPGAIESIPLRYAVQPSFPPLIRPDIVAILSESFWDPTQLPGVRFSSDPVPFYHALCKETRQLRFLSPSFGGRTANAEFEFLTGFSMYGRPENEIPYEQFLRKMPMPSVPRFLTKYGYVARAVHSYDRTFYFRQYNYPRLGFSHFEGSEGFAEDSKKGAYIADAEVGKHVIRELQAATDPLFLFAITMQNHGMYQPDRYAKVDIDISSDRLAPSSLATLRTYVQGCHDADAMLGQIVSHLRTSVRPTIVIYFGDHLPSFGPNLAIYQESGLVNGWDHLPDELTLHATSALVWANYPVQLPRNDEVISPIYVWSEILPALGMESWFYTGLLGQMREQVPGLSHAVCADAKGDARKGPPCEAAALLKDYGMLEYDIMAGHRYGDLSAFRLHRSILKAR